MTKRNNKKTPEPMFVGTEPEELQAQGMGSVSWTEESGPVTDITELVTSIQETEVSLHQLEEGTKSTTSFTFIDTSEAATKSGTNSIFKATGYMDFKKLDEKEQGSYNESDFRETEKDPLTFQQIAEKILGSIDGNLPTEEMAVFTPPGQSAGEKEYKHPFDPINDLHYQLNNAIQPLVDSMQKIIRDPYKASEVMSTTHFNYMVKEYGYLHSFLELSHKIIKERLRERN